MVSAANVQAEMSTLVSPGVAVKLLVPSLSVAPTGMAETSTAKLSDPSVSTSAGSMLRAIAVSWSPVTSSMSSVGASATAATVTASSAVLVAMSPFSASMLVAMTVRVKSASLSAGGVMVREDSVQPEMSAVVLPLVAVKLLAPSLRVAPTGMALISSDSSLGPVGVRQGRIDRQRDRRILVARSVRDCQRGASATADTETDRSPLVVACRRCWLRC